MVNAVPTVDDTKIKQIKNIQYFMKDIFILPTNPGFL
jgi:hypothetical protein